MSQAQTIILKLNEAYRSASAFWDAAKQDMESAHAYRDDYTVAELAQFDNACQIASKMCKIALYAYLDAVEFMKVSANA